MQNGAVELGRLQKVLPAMGHQRAADEGDRRQAVEEPELAQCVGEIDLGLRRDRLIRGAPSDIEPTR